MAMLVLPGYGFVRNKSYNQSCTHNAKNVTKLRSAEKRPEDQKITVFSPKLMIYKQEIPARAPQLEARSGKDRWRDVM